MLQIEGDGKLRLQKTYTHVKIRNCYTSKNKGRGGYRHSLVIQCYFVTLTHTQSLSWGQHLLSSRSAPSPNHAQNLPALWAIITAKPVALAPQPSIHLLNCYKTRRMTPVQKKKKQSLCSFIGARFLTYTVMYLLNRVLCRNYTLSI